MAGRFDALTQLTKKPSLVPPQQEQESQSSNNQPASKPASQQTSKLTNQQGSLEAKKQTSKVVNQQASKPVRKFGSYLTEDSIKALKRIAFETDRKDYEILQDAVDHYLERTQE